MRWIWPISEISLGHVRYVMRNAVEDSRHELEKTGITARQYGPWAERRNEGSRWLFDNFAE
jgi:hypothetical protein